MTWIMVVIRSLSTRSIALVFASLILLTMVLLLDVGFMTSLYNIYDDLIALRVDLHGKTITISSYSLAPFTSVIRISDVEKLLKDISNDVEDVVYEVVTLANINGRNVIVRGIDFNTLDKYLKYNVVEGVDFNEKYVAHAWIGVELARRLEVKVGDIITLSSFFSKTTFTLAIAGVINITKPYCYELIVPYELGLKIRNIGRDKASIAIVILKPQANITRLLYKLGVRKQYAPLLERAIVALKYVKGEVRSTIYERASELYLMRLGIHRDVLVITTIALGFILSIGYHIIGQLVMLLNRDRLIILHEQGLSIMRVKVAVIIMVTLLMLISFSLTQTLLPLINELTDPHIIGHRINIKLETSTLSITTMFALLFLLTGILVVKLYEEYE